MKRNLQLLGILQCLMIFLSAGYAHAECVECKLIDVNFTATLCSDGPFTVAMESEGQNGRTMVTAEGSAIGCAYAPATGATAKVKYNESYSLMVSAGKASSAHIVLKAPNCTRLFINGEEKATVDINNPNGCQQLGGAWSIMVKPVAEGMGGPGTGGSGGGSVKSIHWDFSMGGLPNGTSAESIRLSETEISSTIYTTASLQYAAPSPEVLVIRDGAGALRQIKAPEVLADLVTITPQKYEIRYYPAANAGVPTGGLYQPTGNPFVVWTIENPITALNQQLRITETRNGADTMHDFVHDPATGEWSLSEGGLRTVIRSTTTLSNGDRQTTVIIKNPTNGAISSKRRETRHTFAWGEEVISAVEDPDGSALTTTTAYNENTAYPTSYGKRKWTIQGDGSWERFIYDDYGIGNLIYVLRPWKDSPSTPDQANIYNCHATQYSYGSSDYSYFPTEINASNEYVFGNLVGYKQYHSYSVTYNNLPAMYKGDHVFDSSYNLIRNFPHVTTYKNSAPQPFTNQVAEIKYPDGRQDSYDYEFGNFNYGSGVFSPGTGLHVRQTLTHGTTGSPAGLANRTSREIVVRDPSGKVLLEQKQIYTGSTFASTSATRHFYDSQGRLFKKQLDTGRIIFESSWPAPRQQVVVNEEGQATTLSFDALGRIITESSAGVTTTYSYDADGRRLSATRAAGVFSFTNSKVYDLAGRIKTQTQEDGSSVATAYSNAGRVQTRTLMNGGTEVIERYLDGQTKSITGSGVIAIYYDYGMGSGYQWTKESFGSATSNRWRTTTNDAAGSPILIEQPAFSGTTQVALAYDKSGHQIRKQASNEAAEVTTYDELGNLFRHGLDVDDSGSLEASGSDRIIENEVFYALEDDNWFRVTKQSQYEVHGSATPNVVSTKKEQLTGLDANVVSKSLLVDQLGQSTTGLITINRNTQTVTETSDVPDSNLDAVRVYINKLLKSEKTTNIATPTLYDYDALGREQKVTDPRGVESTTTYNAQGRIETITEAGKTITLDYYPAGQAGAGQIKSTLYPDGKRVYHRYTIRGEEDAVWGSGTYPTEAVYDQYGQYKELHSFRQGSGWDGATFPTSNTGPTDTTIWSYQEGSGLLLSKTDSQGRAVGFTYNSVGKVASRTWARGVSTKYYYNWLGETAWVDYSDATPDLSYSYDRAGRVHVLTDAAGAHTYARSNTQRTETINEEGILSGLILTESFDGFGRRNALSAGVTGVGGWTQTTNYGYNSRSQLENVYSGGGAASYGYLPNSSLVETVTFTSGMQVLETAQAWDAANRLRTVTNTWSGGVQSFDATSFDNANRRKQVVSADGSRWDYGYNDHGELNSGSRKWGNGTNVAGQQYAYGYDVAGNRVNTTINGRVSVHTPNTLNQLGERTVPGAADVIGSANQSATVKVNTLAPGRFGEYYYKELPVANGSNSVFLPIQIEATSPEGTTTRQGHIFVPKTPEACLYDWDGNLQSDGHWTYTWDGENRLVSMETNASVPVDAKRKLAFAYDSQDRRVRKQVWHWNTAQNKWMLHLTIRFAYDGKKLIAELADTGRRVRTYSWGLDVSGTSSGAGGVGGLLFEQDHFANKNFAVAYDLNGNVTALVGMSSGVAEVIYEHGPFGEIIRSSGELAKVNPLRWSTKYSDDETGLVYYGLRYYQPATGRWLTRDPLGEAEGSNLYGYVCNNPNTWIDDFGGQMVARPPMYRPPPPRPAPAPLRPGNPSGGGRPQPRPGPRPYPVEPPDAPPGNGGDNDDDPFERFVLTASAPQDTARDCGSFKSIIDWTLTPFARKGGSVVQTVTIKEEKFDCVTKEKKTHNEEYTEGWRINTIKAFIKPGSPWPNTFDPYASDQFELVPDYNCTYGVVTFEASAAFYHGVKLPANFGTNAIRPWGNVPGVDGIVTMPALPSSNTVRRTLTATWNCCNGVKKTEISHKPTPKFPLYGF